MIKDSKDGDMPDDQVTERLECICDSIGSFFDYLRANVLNVASRHFQYALGTDVFEKMGTNNLSEAQNGRFDRFVGASTSVGSFNELLEKGIQYVASGCSTFLAVSPKSQMAAANTSEMLSRSQSKPKKDASLSLGGWKLGEVLQNARRLKSKTTLPEFDFDDMD